jgi:NADP-dependent 3-hydroxy acid dehydrogenase YdfG
MRVIGKVFRFVPRNYNNKHILVTPIKPINLSSPIHHIHSLNMVNTKGKNIIITGGARGIGRAAARYLLSQPLSHRVFLIDLDGEELEYAATKHLSAYAPRVGHATANLRSPGEIRKAVSKAVEYFGGKIDVLVNNAGT